MLARLGPLALIYGLLFSAGALILSPWLWLIALPAWGVVALDVVRELWGVLTASPARARARIPCRRR